MRTNNNLSKTVKFMSSDNGVDFMKDVTNGSIYARVPAPGRKGVEWFCTHFGELLAHLRGGIEITVVDHYDNILFTEVTAFSNSEKPYTKKKGPFWSEALSETAGRLRSEQGALTYEDWKKRLNGTCDPNVYSDNWAFSSEYVETVEKETVQDNILVLSRVMYLLKTTYRHKFVPFVWESYELHDVMNTFEGKFDPCIAIVGYRFIEEGNDNA